MGKPSIRWVKQLLLVATAAGLVYFFSCTNSVTSPQTPFADFYFTTQITGWVPDSSSHFAALPVASLYNGSKDGGAITYDSAGLVKWFREKMNGGDSADSINGQYSFDGWVFDFGTSAKAKALFATITASNMRQNPQDTFSDTVPLPSFSLAEAEARRVQGGINVYATFGKYYFELSLSGFAEPLTAAPEAIKFLNKYKSLAQ
jgi:hypothetical protein